MPLLRFDATYDRNGRLITPAPAHLARFLASHPALPGLVVQTVWPVDAAKTGETVCLWTRGLRPQEAFVTTEASPFEALKQTAALFNGSIIDTPERLDETAWQRGGMDRFLESVALQKTDETPEKSDLIVMVRGDRAVIEKALEMALSFSARRDPQGVQMAMMRKDTDETPAALLRIQALASSYPVHVWQTEPGTTLFYRLHETSACYVQWGYRHPLPELDRLHPAFAAQPDRMSLALIAWDGHHTVWRHIHDARDFRPVARIADVRLNGREQPQRFEMLDERAMRDRRFQITLSLKRAATRNNDASAAVFHGQSLKDRIRTLEMQRARIDRELNHLKNLEHTHYLCLFEEPQAEALLRFAMSYPLSRLCRFLYLACHTGDKNRVTHVILSKEDTGRNDLPGEISDQGQVFVRDRAWHMLGVNVYLPEGYELSPFIGYDNADALLKTIDPDLEPYGVENSGVILRPDHTRGGDAIEKLIIPSGQAMELTDAVQYLNHRMRTVPWQALVDSVASMQMAQFGHQYNEALTHLSHAYEGLKERFAKAIIALNTDLDEALAELENRKNEMDEYVTASDEMSRFCREMRLLIQNPGNVLFDFIRKETEMFRRLAEQLAAIDYRYNIQFEKYQRQVNEVLKRDHDGLQTKLTALLQRLKQDGAALQHQAEGLQRAFEQYRHVPQRLKRTLNELKTLSDTLQKMADRKTKAMGPNDRDGETS